MKKLNKKLIEELRNGDIVLEHIGMVEDLNYILKKAFPEDHRTADGSKKFYSRYGDGWMGVKYVKQTPSHPTSDFFIDEEDELKWGEPVVVRDSENGKWYGGYIYVGRNPKTDAVCSYIAVNENSGVPFQWKFCKRKQLKFTRAEYAEKLGISIDQICGIELID